MAAYQVILNNQSSAQGPVINIILNVETDSAGDAVNVVADEMQALQVFNLSTLNLADVSAGGVSMGIQALTLSGSGAIAQTINPVQAGLYRVTVPSGATSAAITLGTGGAQVDGQRVELDFISSPAGCTEISVNGVVVANTSNSLYRADSITATAENSDGGTPPYSPHPPIAVQARYSSALSAWIISNVATMGESGLVNVVPLSA